MFLNCTNHPSAGWEEAQIEAANALGGEIVDLPFPAIRQDFSSDEIDQLVGQYLETLQSYAEPVVLVMGEFVFTYRLVTALKQAGIKAVATNSERRAVETKREDGSVMKQSVFVFARFLEY